MVVRELYSNALDEHGGTSIQTQVLGDLEDKSTSRTIIALRCDKFLYW